MKQKLSNFLKVFIPFSVALFFIQFAISRYVLEVDLYYATHAIYIFHIVATFLIYIFLLYVNHNFSDKTGFAFMACSLLKMMAAVLFLIPMMLSDDAKPINDIFAFFIPYFLFLIFETFYAIKLINTK